MPYTKLLLVSVTAEDEETAETIVSAVSHGAGYATDAAPHVLSSLLVADTTIASASDDAARVAQDTRQTFSAHRRGWIEE